MKIFLSPSSADVWVVAARLQALAAVYGFECGIPPQASRNPDPAAYDHPDWESLDAVILLVDGDTPRHQSFLDEEAAAMRSTAVIHIVTTQRTVVRPKSGKAIRGTLRHFIRLCESLLILHREFSRELSRMAGEAEW